MSLVYPERHEVLVACHLRFLRDVLRMLVENTATLRVVGEAAAGEHALSLAREWASPVLLLDAALPPSCAADLLARLGDGAGGARVIAFSVEPEPAFLSAASCPQLFGYLTLDEPASALVAALEGAAEGTAGWFSRSVIRQLQLASGRSVPAGLSSREIEVLQLVADGHQGGSVADALGISELTVKRHVSNAMAKTNTPSRTAAVAEALRSGLIR